jgi:hypothetical protein
VGGGPTPVGRDSGIVGGRQVPAGKGPAASIPRGTVIGGEAGPAGRAPAGYARAGGASESAFGASQQGRSSATGRPFTQGGSGLVRGQNGGAQGGMAGMRATSAQPQPGVRDERRGIRADYLAEDEETWLSGNRRVVPPVID